MDSDYDYSFGDYSSYGSYNSNDGYDAGYGDGYEDGYNDGYGDRYDDPGGYDYYGYDGSYRDYIDGYKGYTDSYKDYIDSYEDYINGSRHEEDCEYDTGYVLGDRDSTEAVFGDEGYEEDYDYVVYGNVPYHNACYGVDQNHFYDNGFYTNGGHGNAKYSKPYRGVCRNGARRNAIYTDGVHGKAYHHKPENKSGGYIKNDLYGVHAALYWQTQTHHDQQRPDGHSTPTARFDQRNRLQQVMRREMQDVS